MARLAEVGNFSHWFLGSMVNLCQPANLFSIKWYIGKGRMVGARGRVRARARVSAYAHEGFEPRLAGWQVGIILVQASLVCLF